LCGYQPTWRADGKEIFFLSGDGKLLAVAVESSPTSFKAGIPEPLFQTRLEAESQSRNYDVFSDGKRFLLVLPTDAGGSVPLTVILNWQALLKR